MTTAELPLGEEADAVPRARQFTARILAGAGPDGVADAQLVVTELVTNAKLHGQPPVVLRLERREQGCRVEVQDRGRSIPMQPRENVDSMTGRGLSLVRAVATSWGVQPVEGGGKVIWAEIAEDGRPADEDAVGDLDVNALLAAWGEEEPDAPVGYRVVLGAVPTALLLEAKWHVDSVVRELTLAGGDQSRPLPPEMRALVTSVTEDFMEARNAIKQHALAAAQRGDAFTDLTLFLPLSAADAGERYLEALDESDRYARASRLLTLAPPASHRAFRRWYVQALVDQLRAVARGDDSPLPPLFPQVLAEEVNRLSAMSATTQPIPLVTPRVKRNDAGEWRWSDAVRACSELRTCTRGASSLEAAAQRVVTHLRSAFVDPETGASAFVLARVFKTEELRNLPPALAEVGRAAHAAGPRDRFLTLLATAGDEPQWCDRRQSLHHQLIPVLSAETVEQAPMVSALVRELGVGIDAVVHGASEAESMRVDFGVFHVERALGSSRVPAQDFVREHGVQSVVGFGGLLPSGHTFAVVLFSRVPVSTESARLFQTVALSVKLALLPHVTSPVFDEHPVLPARLAPTDRVQIRALEEMLDVHERTALEQASELERRDEQLRREADTIDTLRRVGEALAAVLDVDSVVQLTTSAAVDVTGAQFGAFFYNTVDDNGESYMLYTLAGMPRDAFAGFGMPRNTPVFGPTFRGDGVVRSADITTDPRYGKVAPHHGIPKGHPPVRSYLAVPVISPTSREVLGGLFFGHEQVDVFDKRAERLALGIAAQTAVALDNATLYRRERQTALQLQQALLPVAPPELPHIKVAHRYQPGTEGLHVGGDWYDVISLGENRLALVIGDVMGRGVRAAATMGQLRTSIRAFAALDLEPSLIADKLNQIVVDLPDEQIATFLYAVYDATAQSLVYTSAGHLPPVLITRDGARALPADQGPPLGIPHATFSQHVVTISPGDGIVLFTDGLVESRTRPAEDGVGNVEDMLRGIDVSPEEICDQLLAAFAEDSDGDDVAVLVARFA
ncbi:MAG TPA: SpoIIE family protein phosphatase [Mycobacteriales bacterium]|nr:SpoIIE family protein phosphatase [Mycobacteriales bacterium]